MLFYTQVKIMNFDLCIECYKQAPKSLKHLHALPTGPHFHYGGRL